MKTHHAGPLAYTADPWPPAPNWPTLVFVAGAGLSKSLWTHQREGLAQVANLVCLDLPGHGAAPGPGRDTITAYSALVADFCETANLPRPIPCGLSMGGAIVQQLLLDRPERFEAGILLNTGAKLRVMPLIFETIAKGKAALVELLLAGAVAEKNKNDPMRDRIQKLLAEDLTVVKNDFKACDAFDVRDRLAEIQVPVLVIGGAEDATTPAKYAAYLADNIAQAELVMIPDAGHLAPLEQPAAINQAIFQFLKTGNN